MALKDHMKNWPTDEAGLIAMADRQSDDMEHRMRDADPGVLLDNDGWPVAQYGQVECEADTDTGPVRARAHEVRYADEVCAHHRLALMDTTPGYVTRRIEYVTARMADGLRQVRCERCGRWMFPDEVGVPYADRH